MKKYQKKCKYYTEVMLILPVTCCVSISVFASLVAIAVGIPAGSAVRIKICAVTAGIKKYNQL